MKRLTTRPIRKKKARASLCKGPNMDAEKFRFRSRFLKEEWRNGIEIDCDISLSDVEKWSPERCEAFSQLCQMMKIIIDSKANDDRLWRKRIANVVGPF